MSGAATSTTERTVLAGTEVLQGRRRGPMAFLPFVGPAVVASIAYVDPGNFATNIQAGASYAYMLLWVVVWANLVAMLFQSMSARLGIVTGHSLAELCRERFPAPLVIAMWVASEIAAMATDLAGNDRCGAGAVVVVRDRDAARTGHRFRRYLRAADAAIARVPPVGTHHRGLHRRYLPELRG